MKRYIRSNEYIVTVGDVEDYRVSAVSERDAIQFVLDNYLSPEDREEYEDDPGYLWAREAEDEVFASTSIEEYKGFKIYEGPDGCYIYAQPKGKGKVEFPTEKEARGYIDTLK